MEQRVEQREAPAIQVSNLVKTYPKAKTNAVDGVSFEVAQGGIFGLLGPNGAGKTTTIGVLTTAVVPTSGSTSIMGVDVATLAGLVDAPARAEMVRVITDAFVELAGVPAEAVLVVFQLTDEIGFGGQLVDAHALRGLAAAAAQRSV